MNDLRESGDVPALGITARLLTGMESGEALAMCRIGIVAVLTTSLLAHLGSVTTYFSDAAPLFGEYARAAFPTRWSLFFYFTSPLWVCAIYTVGVVAHVVAETAESVGDRDVEATGRARRDRPTPLLSRAPTDSHFAEHLVDRNPEHDALEGERSRTRIAERLRLERIGLDQRRRRRRRGASREQERRGQREGHGPEKRPDSDVEARA